MAPREATGSFPDTFLTYEYDAANGMGMPPPHDPAPALPTQQPVTEQAPEGAAGASGPVGSSTQLSGSGGSPAEGSSNVDPLSIDPTLHQSTLNWNVNRLAQRGGSSSLPVDNATVTGQQQEQISRPAPVRRTVTAVNSGLSTDTTVEPSSGNHGDESHDGTTPTTQQQHPSNPTALPPSPHSPISFGGSPIPIGTNLAASRINRNRSVPLRSVLDNINSIESDDEEEEDDVPGLDTTFDSATSASTMDNDDANIVTDEDYGSDSSSMDEGEGNISLSSSSSDSLRMIQRNAAFDLSNDTSMHPTAASPTPEQEQQSAQPPMSPNSILLSFGPNTTLQDLEYFAERGCIVALLQALTTSRLIELGTRMVANYAKLTNRRVAVASNRRILEFLQRTMLQGNEGPAWIGRENAVEAVRSITATEESDQYLMGTPGLLNSLALVARGGPFLNQEQENGFRTTTPLASDKGRLHACIAIMNLSCGKANKIEIAKLPDVLEAMRDVMVNTSDEARLKATTCIKNLSNADANDAALLGTPGLVEALGHVASVTCTPEVGATTCTTNACLALMNLSISKANKHRVFRTPGVMEALMTVLERTTAQGSSNEARIKACSALSNLAIGYDNKIPMFNYAGFVDAILNVIQTDTGEARTKACSILWSFAAEMKNQVPVVQRGDILPTLVQVAEEDGTTEARFKCVAALTLLAESLDNAIPLLQSGALAPLMDILHEAGPDPTQWKGQTASWCVGFLMNIAQSDEAAPHLREAGVVELLAPLLTLDHYQSLKAAMAVTFVCRYDEGDETYDLLRKTENVIPKIISLLHNTLSGKGGNGYKYGVFTLRSSVGCIASLASGPDFMKERIATGPVYESLLRVTADFCVDGGTPGAIVGGGRDDALSATLAVRALHQLTGHLIPVVGSSALPFDSSMEDRLLTAFESFESCAHPEILEETRAMATDAKIRIEGGRKAAARSKAEAQAGCIKFIDEDVDMNDMASLAANSCCVLDTLPTIGEQCLKYLTLPGESPSLPTTSNIVETGEEDRSVQVRTFLLADVGTGRRFAVPLDPSGGRSFNDTRKWCYRRGRFCGPGEEPDADFKWTDELQQAYEAAISGHGSSSTFPGSVIPVGATGQ
mmetsp:Transcript_5467/g.8336  ORF Transcript_5467/g.8336 Transcript_5467/m.8336 type:complete len:1123 (+) Transcript_5467:93-3461(+)|eukprot:CAMPEP_0195283412 /NCGR_PEP_ID=MMETSP0707-20130614/1962_1 /TAXON_ID=33640 /ORGANISM="Asterionellopsis glacialis, Strain CCMP134" /LENGTH=1122 /DNA_ID=CAMNT_0040342575 /DNA_START=42 /DNA_END=3410 /DNA_ORIENTATION=-